MIRNLIVLLMLALIAGCSNKPENSAIPTNTAQLETWGEAVNGLQCRITSDKEVYAETESIFVTFTLKNISKNSYVYLIPDIFNNYITFWKVETANGKLERLTPYGQGILRQSDYASLSIGKEISYKMDIATIWRFTHGQYKISTDYQGQKWYKKDDGSISEMDGVFTGTLKSNTIAIKVVGKEEAGNLVSNLLKLQTKDYEPEIKDTPFYKTLGIIIASQGKKLEDYLTFHSETALGRFTNGQTIKINSGNKEFVVAILGELGESVPGISAQQLILITPDGRILDKIGCDINSRYGEIRSEIKTPSEADGAQIVIVFDTRPRYNPSGWHNYHEIVYQGKTFTFREDEKEQPSVWDKKGLCRIKIANDKFDIIFPTLTGEVK